MKKILHFFILAFSAAWLAIAQAEPSMPALHSITVQENSIIFAVTSHGCSKDADFKLRVEEGGTVISLIRKRPDRCKRMPMVMRIKRSMSEIGLSLQTPFAINNPFTPPPSKGKTPTRKYPSKGKPFYK